MNLTITPLLFSKNNYRKNSQTSTPIFSNDCDVFISFGKKKHKIQSPREIALQDALYGHNIMVHPETLSYIFNTRHHEEKRFKEYKALGSCALETYKRTTLMQKFPSTSEGEFNALQRKLDYSITNHIAKNLFNDEMFLGEIDKSSYAQCLCAVLGAIALEDNKGEHENLVNFLNSRVRNFLSKDYSAHPSNPAEKYQSQFQSMGYDLDKLFIKTKKIGADFRSKIYYNDTFIASSYGAKTAFDAYNQGIKIAVYEGQKRNLNELKPDTTKPLDFRKPDEKRKSQLEALCEKYNIKINDLNLLNRAFITGKMPDGSYIAHHETYEILEYVGDAVLGFCTQKIIDENLERATKQDKTRRFLAFVSNNNLIKLSKEMGLPKLLIGEKTNLLQKEYGNIVEAIIGAIYIDGGKNGFDNAYEFIDTNFRERIIGN